MAGTIGLIPHRQRIATAVECDLWVKGFSYIVGFNQFRGAPAAAVKTVGPDAIAAAIGLMPHRQRITAAIECDLWIRGSSRTVINQFRGAPGTLGGGKRPTVIGRQGITAKICDGCG